MVWSTQTAWCGNCASSTVPWQQRVTKPDVLAVARLSAKTAQPAHLHHYHFSGGFYCYNGLELDFQSLQYSSNADNRLNFIQLLKFHIYENKGWTNAKCIQMLFVGSIPEISELMQIALSKFFCWNSLNQLHQTWAKSRNIYEPMMTKFPYFVYHMNFRGIK